MSSENLREEIGNLISDCVNRQSFTAEDLDQILNSLRNQIEQMELPQYPYPLASQIAGKLEVVDTWHKIYDDAQQELLKDILSKLQ